MVREKDVEVLYVDDELSSLEGYSLPEVHLNTQHMICSMASLPTLLFQTKSSNQSFPTKVFPITKSPVDYS